MISLPEVKGSVNPRVAEAGKTINLDLVFEGESPKEVIVTIQALYGTYRPIDQKSYPLISHNRFSKEFDTRNWERGEYELKVELPETKYVKVEIPPLYITRFKLY